jgi:hypothetical protein
VKLWRIENAGYAHWCPACNELHTVLTDAGQSPRWGFDNNLTAPTFTPSVRISDSDGTRCHYVLTSGVINYCPDSRHSLKGQAVPLPDIPPEYGATDK